ncbi:MAG TPA: hypothetical protein DD390_12085 [Rhodospirillaceae bacterium]|nr:hypothetical protein [Rhodospirillaceae bacterium]MAX61936.1 hypothetical protein [Rhodospirillaceae bacterium]MAX63272.1 hypothetical protein [Rhodospirillaceae bacterium]HBM13426.1 hypothetical protein [Rhodospirillaceae bacterium]|tara:strand:+ start:25143 stop:27566 length:2424 start_codon:yes stop_codon:yes gene_type:complete
MKSRIKARHLNPHIEQTYLWLAIMIAAGGLGAYLGLLCAYPVDVIVDSGLSGPSLQKAGSAFVSLLSDPALLFKTLKVWIRNAWVLQSVPYSLIACPLVAGVGLSLMAKALAPELSLRETHLGAAEWAEQPFLKKQGLLGSFGLVLGRFGHPFKGTLIRGQETLSAMVISPPGTGKTVNLIGGILANHPDKAPIPGPSMVINDPKGEIYAKTAGWRSTLGPVFHVRWTDLEGTSFNPLSLKNIKGCSEIIPRRRQLIERLSGSYVDPGRALSAMMVAARDFGDDWRDRVYRDPTLHFAVEISGARGLSLQTDADSIRAALFPLQNGIPDETLFEEISELSALHSSLDTYVNRIAAVAVPESGSGSNSIWEKNGRAAFTGFCLYMMFKAIDRSVLSGQPCEASIGGLIAWLAGAGVDTTGDPEKDGEKMEKKEEDGEGGAIDKLLETGIAEATARGYPARVAEELKSLKDKPAKERGSVISTALGKLQVFKSEAIRARTSRSDITFEDLRGIDGRPVTVYFDIPLEDAEAVGIPTGFFLEGAAAYLISQDEKVARTRPVIFMLDEFWTLPKMESIQQIPALGRGQWVQLVLIGQSFAQIALKLGQEALNILKDAIAFKIYFTMNDTKQAKEVSEAIGNQTMETVNSSSSAGLVNMNEMLKSNNSRSFQGVPLVRPDELMSMPKLTPAQNIWGEVVIQISGMMNRPIKATPVIWFKDRELRSRAGLTKPGFARGPSDIWMKDWSGGPMPNGKLATWNGRPKAAAIEPVCEIPTEALDEPIDDLLPGSGAVPGAAIPAYDVGTAAHSITQ